MLYNPENHHDNCGFGLIAQLSGKPSHALVTKAISALNRMTHRGAVNADGKTGDGCGLLMQLPVKFFRSEAQRYGVELSRYFAVGMVFLSNDAARAAEERTIVSERINSKQGLQVAWWREAPVNTSVLGDLAAQSQPRIYQVFVNTSTKRRRSTEFALYKARHEAMHRLRGRQQFYICSLSSKLIGYKGLMMPKDLANFYLDLQDQRLETAICVFHQRFSTNTDPNWVLAQPFRMLAHNGEINTINGNRNSVRMRLSKLFRGKLKQFDFINKFPINTSGSDSRSLDNMLEMLVQGGKSVFDAIRLIIPPAWENDHALSPAVRAYHNFNALRLEAWDGPAGCVFTDGRYAVCLLDRNGLRPARWLHSKEDYVILSSEVGVDDCPAADVVDKGRVGPGQIMAIDTKEHKILSSSEIDSHLAAAQPFDTWVHANVSELEVGDDFGAHLSDTEFQRELKYGLCSPEEVSAELIPMLHGGQEAVGSMGDDTPIAALSSKPRLLSDYFRQLFAQVTNPAIDSLRESNVMSLRTALGRQFPIFGDFDPQIPRLSLRSPVLSSSQWQSLQALQHDDRLQQFPERLRVVELSLAFDQRTMLDSALRNLTLRAQEALEHIKLNRYRSPQDGVLLLLDDSSVDANSLAIPAPLAVGAVHHALIASNRRADANIIVSTREARTPHHFAVLLGLGASAVYPHLSYALIERELASGEHYLSRERVFANYRKAIDKSILKILSKMGIATLASYRGAQLFEALGLAQEVIDLCFVGLQSRIGGLTFNDIHDQLDAIRRRAWDQRQQSPRLGLHKFVHGGEYHAFNPDVVSCLRLASKNGDQKLFREYSRLVNERAPATLRDLLEFNSRHDPLSIDAVEPATAILPRFDSAGMSLGALSPEAHETLARAMCRIGARSNSGEGGEDPQRFKSPANSKIKQVASGRFGVTTAYLRSAEVIQIKVAQGAKPGEGGQLPGGKVNQLIAELRYALPGTTLISPPPHHDIYSIEDLAQLIFDLKQVNPKALVSVKLVSEPGVGTVACGVAKAYADLITISGYDGGTAASPLSSIHYAGAPWELGLAETHQALVANNLRHRIRLQTDGGLKTGRDVVKAAMLGAESFGFGTTPMIAMGCKYLRICHLNNCATGVATQHQQLRDDYFIGAEDMVVNFFEFIAQEVREILAELGYADLQTIIGRSDLLRALPAAARFDLQDLLETARPGAATSSYCTQAYNTPPDELALAQDIERDCRPLIKQGASGEFVYDIKNSDRSIGTLLAGSIAEDFGDSGLPQPLQLNFSGYAGQSFGAWNINGLHLHLDGDANDYVGKGMTGGRIVVAQQSSADLGVKAVIGNTCLYGATGGYLYAAGAAGERFAVRNSGACATLEGAGDHCCEYMTGGLVIVLGRVGRNFGAGMSGGLALVHDPEAQLESLLNTEMVELRELADLPEALIEVLREQITQHAAHTASPRSQHLLENFTHAQSQFRAVVPQSLDANRMLASARIA